MEIDKPPLTTLLWLWKPVLTHLVVPTYVGLNALMVHRKHSQWRSLQVVDGQNLRLQERDALKTLGAWDVDVHHRVQHAVRQGNYTYGAISILDMSECASVNARQKRLRDAFDSHPRSCVFVAWDDKLRLAVLSADNLPLSMVQHPAVDYHTPSWARDFVPTVQTVYDIARKTPRV